jgi:hypothetical protein
MIFSAPRMRPVLILSVLAAVTATASNVVLYRDARAIAGRSGRMVQAEVRSRKQVSTVCLVGVPRTSHGVVFFGEEVAESVRSVLRGTNVAVRTEDGPGCGGDAGLLFRWNPETQSLQPASRFGGGG